MQPVCVRRLGDIPGYKTAGAGNKITWLPRIPKHRPLSTISVEGRLLFPLNMVYICPCLVLPSFEQIPNDAVVNAALTAVYLMAYYHTLVLSFR